MISLDRPVPTGWPAAMLHAHPFWSACGNPTPLSVAGVILVIVLNAMISVGRQAQCTDEPASIEGRASPAEYPQGPQGRENAPPGVKTPCTRPNASIYAGAPTSRRAWFRSQAARVPMVVDHSADFGMAIIP